MPRVGEWELFQFAPGVLGLRIGMGNGRQASLIGGVHGLDFEGR